MSRVGEEFFDRPVEEVASDMIGRGLTVHDGEDSRTATLIETEAYGGPDDPASHAAFKPNGRASVMWEAPGTIYVYAAYGVYPCLNIVTGPKGIPSAVLVRGIVLSGAGEPTWGPGRAARALGVSVADNGIAWRSGRFELSVERYELPRCATPRIGISRATEIEWRFVADLSDVQDWTTL